MNCDELTPYLPGYAGGELRPHTARIVEDHLEGCPACSVEVARLRRVTSGLALLATREVHPPPHLFPALIEDAAARANRRALPVLPVAPAEVLRVIQDNRETITQAAGTALVAAGAAYAVWRAVRRRRAEPAPS